MKKVVVLQSNYIPWKGYFDLIHDADVFVYYDNVKYTKNDWRNRNKIYSKNGLQWLTIPIAKEAVRLTINAVKIEAPMWQELHYKSLYYAYKASPFFQQLEPLLSDVYLDRKWTMLVDINRYFIEKISRMLGINTVFLDSQDFFIEGDRVDRLINLLKQVKAEEYISGPSAKQYLLGHEHRFDESGIVLKYKDYIGYPVYRQLKEPFEHNVSILDMIANIELGNVGYYIWGWRTAQ